MSRSAVPRSRVVQVLAASAAVGLIPVALTAVHLPRAAEAPTVQPATSPPTFTSKWIAIQTGTPSQITLNGPSGQVGAAQTLAPATNCGMNQGVASSRYVTFKGSTGGTFDEGLASYQVGSIGVKEKKSGTSCYRVDSATTESLDLQLGAALTGSSGGKAIASSAFLDLEMKQSARILATAKLGGKTKATFEVQSGATVGLPGIASTPPSKCTGSADSGPDSGTGDNCRWAISMPSWLGADDGIFFDELVLKAVSGSFSLEGGADGSYSPAGVAPVDASIIEVTDAVLNCGQKTQTIAAAGDAPQVYVTRLGNLDATPCELVPYTIQNGPGFAQFLKPLGSQVTAQFVWDIIWSFDHTTSTTRLPEVTIDYESGAPENPTTLGWCPNPQYDTTGTFTGLAGGPGADQDSTLDGVQYACVISRSARAVDGDPDRVASHDQVYVYGDARMGSG
jgi:hypothetical protein